MHVMEFSGGSTTQTPEEALKRNKVGRCKISFKNFQGFIGITSNRRTLGSFEQLVFQATND